MGDTKYIHEPTVLQQFALYVAEEFGMAVMDDNTGHHLTAFEGGSKDFSLNYNIMPDQKEVFSLMNTRTGRWIALYDFMNGYECHLRVPKAQREDLMKRLMKNAGEGAQDALSMRFYNAIEKPASFDGIYDGLSIVDDQMLPWFTKQYLEHLLG